MIDLNILQKRAVLYKTVREFFAARQVLEVETPILSEYATTDVNLASFSTQYIAPNAKTKLLYLHTSPEFYMKRLLAAGSGAIYQIAKVFRNGEQGDLHQPEFSMLEWYQPNYSLDDLMNEVDALIQQVLATPPAKKISYQQLFETHCEFNPHTVDLNFLKNKLQAYQLNLSEVLLQQIDINLALDLLMTHVIEPNLGQTQPCFVYDYPASQAALAQVVKRDDYPVAERFELYYQGVELANGFHELRDSQEQQRRFAEDLTQRQDRGLPMVPMDRDFLACLDDLPDCSGVALGLDRLLMFKINAKKLLNISIK